MGVGGNSNYKYEVIDYLLGVIRCVLNLKWLCGFLIFSLDVDEYIYKDLLDYGLLYIVLLWYIFVFKNRILLLK